MLTSPLAIQKYAYVSNIPENCGETKTRILIAAFKHEVAITSM